MSESKGRFQHNKNAKVILHFCPEMHVIKSMFYFDKCHKCPVESNCKIPVFNMLELFF